MSFTNYGTLKTSVDSWLNRGDLTSYIPDFISLAQADIDADVRHWRMLNRARTTLDAEYTQYPTDLVETKVALLIKSPPKELDIVSPEQLLKLKEANWGATGEPVAIAFEEQIHAWPAPMDSYTLEVLYYQRIAPLTSDEDTNWVLQKYPGLYLYASLKQAAPFLHEDERLVVWDTMYQQTLLKLKQENRRHGSAKVRLPGRVF